MLRVALAFLALASLAAPQSPDNEPNEPFRIADNLYQLARERREDQRKP